MYAPLLIAGLAATMAGTGMQIAGNMQDKSALSAERARESQQQAGFQSKAQGDVNASLAQSTPAVQQQQSQAGAANRLSMYQGLKSAGAPLTAPTDTPTSNTIIGGPSARAATVAGSAGGAWQDLAANAQAREGGRSDWQTQQGVKNAVTMGKLGAIGTEASDAASIYPIEQQVAMQKGDPLNGWGSLLSTLGGLSMMGAAVTAPAAAASTGLNAAGTGPGFITPTGAPATAVGISSGAKFYDPLMGSWTQLAGGKFF
jgi:hypothetical protein